ncbi:antibiotic biosynthesis monooxygenase [Marinomonas sp. 5E14-1]|uniref:antibiotic biosynthesis monooxygenase n=1 Tax=Marinomonas sp. 5E14-1 TaxID=3153922 RepID=UPI003266BFFC
MYHREWKCRCPKETADGFVEYLAETGIKDTQSIEGCTGYQVLKREVGDEVEITFVSFWQEFELMKEYAGDNLYKAVLYPEDHKYRIVPDTEVKVYDVIETLTASDFIN